MTANPRDFWDAQATNFDDEPDHGLRDPEVRETWASLLMPRTPSSVVDLGCGTGSLAVQLAHGRQCIDSATTTVQCADD